MSIVIIGAGIGGLTTALFLEKLGIPYQIFEQATDIKPVGAGIILAHNAMQVFDKLGLKEQITTLGNPLTSINITTAKTKIISAIEMQCFDDKYRVNSVAIQRGVLQTFLISHLDSRCMHLNKKVVDLTVGENLGVSTSNNSGNHASNKALIKFSDETQIECDAIIGADGIHSIIRQKIFEKHTIRNPKQTCWRGIANITLPLHYQSSLTEMWGKGSRFGFVKLAGNEVYWYGLHDSHHKLEKNELLHYFKDYDPVVNEIISHTNLNKVFKSEIIDVKPISSWFHNTICLLGDAAHATTPNMGQGACQAIEDAYAISHYISKHPLNIAFSKYEQVRKGKANMIVNLSWRLGILSQIQNPVISVVRNFVMRLIPDKYNTKQSEKIYTLPLL